MGKAVRRFEEDGLDDTSSCAIGPFGAATHKELPGTSGSFLRSFELR